MKRALRRVSGALALLLATLAGKAALTPGVQPEVQPVAPFADAEGSARRLAEAIRFPTISAAEGHDPAAFEAFRAWTGATWPRVSAALTREELDGALLYTWRGSDPGLPALVLAAHFDVVPASPEGWTHPPFAGVIADGAVWGRGAMDDKNAVVAILDAVEALLAEGHAPRRTVLLAFGHDEEAGSKGAAAIVAAMQARGQRAVMALDEGLVITDGVIAGLTPKAALIGVSERGHANVELLVRDEGGHASLPPPQTAAGVLAAAIARVEARPFPARLDGPTREMLRTLGPEMSPPNRLVMANLWLLDRVVLGVLTGKRSTNATVRTTAAVTQLFGSEKANVLPREARAVLNLRVHPRDDVQGALDRLREVIDDPRVELRLMPGELVSEPSPTSSTRSPGYALLARSLRETFPDTVVAPGLVTGYTDGRLYTPVADDVYRVGAFTWGPADASRIHGSDERILIEDLARAVSFYRRVIEGADAL